MMTGFKKNTLVLLCAIVLIGTMSVVLAAGYLMTSNTVTTSPVAKATLTLTQDTNAPVIGVDKVNYTATCSDTSFSGVVTFKDSSDNVLGSNTAVNGIATISYTPVSVTPIIVTATATHP